MKINIISFNHRIINIILCFSLLLIFIGCKKSSNEFNIISNTNCYPPCWMNIIPGKTTKQEVLTLLKGNSLIDTNSIITFGEPWNSFNDVGVFSISSNIEGNIYFVNDIVVFLGFFGDLNISFSRAIEELGEPEYIVNIPMNIPNKTNEIFALIPKNGINFAYNTHDMGIKSKSEIIPENKITRVGFFDPSYFDYLLEAGTFSEGFLDSVQTKEYMVPWTGYGDIEEKYPPANIK